eukprot:CAMPEP_0172485732 /NCGR_PEP_ID=MMETSP1066-20121228/13889_1 /TAXON_ID=671091 /ORGANISM="Coscinodiscus wailesii, Strain CCMP2513" /LENGTH=45 /DNA_ID= /DNA_START= /DNA_END= /DNA_ORIENTATION=
MTRRNANTPPPHPNSSSTATTDEAQAKSMTELLPSPTILRKKKKS